ncbi:craniofacial development protein 1-like [Oppia nitens]|uniref:craniofacial development protein 1-like n=1 Tax=Oppia nitens TaxID=1686743 RepID=UPI0023DCA4D8|nr:craniofacial development protein 1-like [Oppia nitens]
MSNQLFNTNDDDSDEDNDDFDYKPEKEVLSDDSCSDDAEDGTHNRIEVTQTTDKEKISEEVIKQKEDSIWEEFCKDLPKSDATNEPSNSLNKKSEISTTMTKQTVTKTYDFAGQEVKVTEEVEVKSIPNSSTNSKSEQTDNNTNVRGIKRTAGLGSLVDQLKKSKMSVLQKTFHDWDSFKKNEGIEEELKKHNKSKDTFVDRQAFLQRSDLRQFEIEKQIREKQRNQRQLNKD